MFRTYQVFFNRMLMCLDAFIVAASFGVAWYVKFKSGWLAYSPHQTLFSYRGPILVGVVIFIISNGVAGLYRPMRAKSVFLEAYGVMKSAAVGLVIFMSVLYFAKMDDFSRDALLIFASTFVVLTLSERISIRLVLRAMRRRGMNQKFILIAGWNQAAERFVHTLEQQPWFGYRILGYVSQSPEGQPTLHSSRSGVPCLGSLSEVARILSEQRVDQVVVALPKERFEAIGDVLEHCEAVGAQSLILPDYFDLLPARPRFETFGDIPLIDTRYVPLDDAMNATLKRAFDIIFSAVVMILLSPFFLALIAAVRLSTPGPVIFVQERIGKNRRMFKMYKFRTMRWEGMSGAERDDLETRRMLEKGWTTQDDPRRTRLGAFLRRSSLDELPQFWNVLIGDMSVIGPRPERPFFVDRFKEEIPRYMVKHRVRPGITGWAQVHGWRGDTSIVDRIQYDIEYIENWSFWMDLRIIGKTVKDGFVNQNAY